MRLVSVFAASVTRLDALASLSAPAFVKRAEPPPSEEPTSRPGKAVRPSTETTRESAEESIPAAASTVAAKNDSMCCKRREKGPAYSLTLIRTWVGQTSAIGVDVDELQGVGFACGSGGARLTTTWRCVDKPSVRYTLAANLCTFPALVLGRQ